MTVENDFLIFANTATNIESQTNYVADTAVPNGVVSGIASSAQYNKVARQATTAMALLAAFIQQQLPNQTVLDQGQTGLTTLLSSLTQALVTIVSPWTSELWADSGTANSLQITLSPIPAALSNIEGVPLQIVKSDLPNTGGVSLFVNGLASAPILHSDGSAFMAGQWPAGAIGIVVYNGTNFVCLNDTSPALLAPLASPVFTGEPQGPTAPSGTSTGQFATTSFVTQYFAALNGSPTQSFNANQLQVNVGSYNASISTEDDTGQWPYGFIVRTGPSSKPWYTIIDQDGNLYVGGTVSAADATAASNLLPLGQAQELFAALNGSNSEPFIATQYSTINGLLTTGNSQLSLAAQSYTASVSESDGAQTIEHLCAEGTQPQSAVTLSQFPFSAGGNGSISIPGGLIMQWGSGSVSASGAGVSVGTFTLDEAFPQGPLISNGFFTGTSPPPAGSTTANPISNSQVDIYINTNAAGTFAVGYIVIGH